MPTIIQVTLSDRIHTFLEKLKIKKAFANNVQTLEWIIEEVARMEGLA